MNFLESTFFFDYKTEEIQRIVSTIDVKTSSKTEISIKLYTLIRDKYRYNPYEISLDKLDYRASIISNKTYGHCIDKSIVLISCLRACNIPARLHLAKVKNHIGVDKFVEKYGSNEISPHGMVGVFLNNKWYKVSPAFNKELCEKLGVATLDFDGKSDALFQQFDKSGNQFMDYIEDYGYFNDLPMEFILNNFKENYPDVFAKTNGKLKISV